MAAQIRVLRRRIRSTQSIKKITRAMELIATSRIAKARARVEASKPYAEQMTAVLTELASNSALDHPLLVERENAKRAAVLVVTSDRGQAGGYNANVLREAESLQALLREQGKEPVLYVIGRKGVGYYRFRNRPIAASWTGFSERPSFEDARKVGESLLEAFVAGAEESEHNHGPENIQGVDELHIVSTQFKSLMTQTAEAHFLAPMQVEEREREPGLRPAYEFEPEAEELLDALLPKYLNTRIYAALLDSAASESASRRRAMKSASDNADDLLKRYTREMNSARQAAITQEISEIVGGVEALSASGSDG